MNEKILSFKDNKIKLESQIKKLKENNLKQEEEIKKLISENEINKNSILTLQKAKNGLKTQLNKINELIKCKEF